MGVWKKGISLAVFLVCIFSGVVSGEEKFISEIDRTKQAFIKVDQDNEIWTAYYDPMNSVHIRSLKGDKDFPVNTGEDKARSGLAFDIMKEHLFTAWREKAEGKKLFFRASHDSGKTFSDPILLDDLITDALPRIKIGSNTKGTVVVEWAGEKRIGSDQYHLYAACSDDFGKTFSKPLQPYSWIRSFDSSCPSCGRERNICLFLFVSRD